ncbi:MAG: transcription antiterminator [Lactobacillus sp.]|nr:transcription antiterminator [Lactobacillus sp.]
MLAHNEKEIIDFLINSNSYVTAKEIANQLLLSTKTVYRTIKHLNSTYSSNKLIDSKKGRGFRINYYNYLKEVKIHKFSKKYTADDRRKEILLKLLMVSPHSVKLRSLFGQFYLSDTVINHDLKVIKSILKSYSLSLSRRNYRIKIIGKEINIRKALQDILIKQNTSYLYTKNGIDFNTIRFCVKELEFINKKLKEEVPYPYNVNILSHLYILIMRYNSDSIKHPSLNNLTQEDINIIKNNKTAYVLAKQVIEHVETFLKAKLPNNEIYFLLQYLLSSHLDIMDKIEDYGFKYDLVKRVTNFYIKNVINSLDLHTVDNEFKKDLSNHIRPMINRLYNSINIHNILLQDIKREYLPLFNIIVETSRQLSKKYKLPKISDAENGFITLYFARYLEQNRQYIRALVVCTTGIATAQLIKTKIQAYFNNIIVVGDAASADIKRQLIKYSPIDLIISTIPLNENLGIPIVIVGALLTQQDKKRINDMISRILGSEKMLSDITNESLINLNIKATDWKDAIRKSSASLVREGYATKEYVEGMIKASEESGPYIVISKGVALPHARPELGAKKIGITITTLNTPINFGNYNNDPVEFVFSLCAIDNKSHLKAMSELVNFISNRIFLKKLEKENNPSDVYKLIQEFEMRYNENE